MKNRRTLVIPFICTAVALAAALGGLLIATQALAQSGTVATDGKFEIGDGVDPTVPGVGDIQGDLLQAGPDWDDLFNPDRTFKDLYDEEGLSVSNGVPDFLDTYGKVRSDALFIFDDISAGSATDSSVLAGVGVIGSGIVAAGNDLGNAYAFSAFNSAHEPVLYFGVERLTADAGTLVFEFNQLLFEVDEAGTIVGDRVAGDMKIDLVFTSGVLTSVDLSVWTLIDEVAVTYDWQASTLLPGSPEQPAEQCNAEGTFCAVCNGASVTAGSWTSFDDTGASITELPSNTFLEVGVNLEKVLGTHTYENYYDTRFTSLQISTAEDYALGTFLRASKLAQFRTNQ